MEKEATNSWNRLNDALRRFLSALTQERLSSAHLINFGDEGSTEYMLLVILEKNRAFK